MGQQSSREDFGGVLREPARILIVDDEEQIIRLLSQVFEAEGYDVVTRADGATAVDALGAQQFDLVIPDLAMPGLSGEAVLIAAKALEPPVPVVIVTARSSDRVDARLGLLGADDIVRKPFEMAELMSIVERLLGPPNQEPSDR